MPSGYNRRIFDGTIVTVVLLVVVLNLAKVAANRWRMSHEPGSITQQLGTAIVAP
jgi:hypothetical protein